MKRDHPGADGGSGSVGYGGVTAIDKGKMPFGFEEEEDDGDVDELLAALGYKVRASDMADVALKLEQLEMAMGNTAVAAASDDDSFLPPFGSDVVHYDPSDLSTWLDSMLSEINSPPPMAAPAKDVRNDQYKSQWHFDLPPSLQSHPATSLEAPSIITAVDSPRSAVYSSKSEMVSSRDRKRMKMSTTTTAEATTTACSSSSSSSREGGVGRGIMGSASTEVASEGKTSPSTVTPVPAMPVVLVDTQEAGIRLVHAMMACAEAVQQENMEAADVLVKQITLLAASQGGAMRKVAGYFVEALARRIYGPSPTADLLESSAFADVLNMHFYESCPYLKFAHFTANQAILEAFAGCRRVHVVDFGIKQGMQWPALLQALALRPGGPPSFRLTGIAAPQPDNSDALEHVGWKLARFAETIDVDFKYRALSVASLADLDPNTLLTSPDGAACDDDDEEPEAVAVNSVFELHQLLAHPGAVEKVLGMTRALRPRIVTVVEQEANHNSGSFVDRFTEALHYYSTMFDSLEGGGGISAADDSVAGDLTGSGGLQDRVMSEMYLGRQIRNVVTCEGAERTERHERLERWRERMNRAGFEAVHLGSNAFKQARMLLALYAGGGDGGYRVEERDGCLTLGWHTCPVIATSAWCISGSSGGAAAIAGR